MGRDHIYLSNLALFKNTTQQESELIQSENQSYNVIISKCIDNINSCQIYLQPVSFSNLSTSTNSEVAILIITHEIQKQTRISPIHLSNSWLLFTRRFDVCCLHPSASMVSKGS